MDFFFYKLYPGPVLSQTLLNLKLLKVTGGVLQLPQNVRFGQKNATSIFCFKTSKTLKLWFLAKTDILRPTEATSVCM